jgi:hypothetical protein
MIFGLDTEVFLALLYALFLAGLAFSLEFLARHSHKRAEAYRHSGFIYFRDLDYWECPAGRQLVQLTLDRERRVASYRAAAGDCNSCSLKLNCTDSDTGRVLERRLDSWIESELRRFHRGISLVLLFLATLLLLAESFRFPYPRARRLLVPFAFALAVAQSKLLPLHNGRRGLL